MDLLSPSIAFYALAHVVAFGTGVMMLFGPATHEAYTGMRNETTVLLEVFSKRQIGGLHHDGKGGLGYTTHRLALQWIPFTHHFQYS
jgi:hypothetical protein